MQHPQLPEGEWGEKRLQQVWKTFFHFSSSISLFFIFTFYPHLFLFFREELQEFWNPGQCSAQQYEEMEGLEDSAYDDDDDDLFYEDEYVELEDSAEVNDHEGD